MVNSKSHRENKQRRLFKTSKRKKNKTSKKEKKSGLNSFNKNIEQLFIDAFQMIKQMHGQLNF